jgi:hypothetical protein
MIRRRRHNTLREVRHYGPSRTPSRTDVRSQRPDNRWRRMEKLLVQPDNGGSVILESNRYHSNAIARNHHPHRDVAGSIQKAGHPQKILLRWWLEKLELFMGTHKESFTVVRKTGNIMRPGDTAWQARETGFLVF